VRAAGWLIRRRLRRHWLSLLPLFLIVAIGGTGALVALGAADRTDHAFADYVARANVSDAVINPSLDSVAIRRVIRDLPGVRSVTSDSLYFVSGPRDDGHPRPFGEIEGGSAVDVTQIRGSSDGRYLDADRPSVRAGRLPSGPDEAFVSVEVARRHHLSPGDRLSIAFWNQNPELLGDADQVVSPLGVERLRLVGIGTFADDVLPDRLYPHARVIVSPDVAARYDCRPTTPPDDATLEQALATLKPDPCSAVSYRYYALHVPGGDRAVGVALDAFVRRAAALNERLPPVLTSQDVRYILISTRLSADRDRIERATRPTVLALLVLGLVAAAVTVTVAGLAFARELRRAEPEQLNWWRLGLGAPPRLAAVTAPALVAVATGLLVALGGAWLLSTVGPVGTVRDVDPSPARELAGWSAVAFGVMLVALALLLVGLAVPWLRRSRRVSWPPPRFVARLVPRFARPETGEGVRAAYGGRLGSGVVVASAVVACTVFLAAVVFGASLSALVSTPKSYGWPWQGASVSNFGYGGLDLEAARAGLADDRAVSRATALGFTPVTLDREPVATAIAYGDPSALDLALVEGRFPEGAREVALGSRTASDRGLSVGDEVDLDGNGLRPHRAKVTGLVVLPAVGPFQSERLAPGEGMLMPAAGFQRAFAENGVAFFGFHFTPGTSATRALADLRRPLRSWDPTHFPPLTFASPIRPAEIDDAAAMRTIPFLVGALLLVSTVIGLGVAVVLSVRARRRDLAVLRALGFTAGQVRRSVRVQSVATVLPAVVVGVPLGVVLGRFLWRAFAEELGVVTSITIPLVWVFGTVAGALVVALVASAIPARVAARIAPAAALRAE